MRYGFTTGSCAAAAAKAAAYMLLSGREKTRITIDTPKGIRYTADVLGISRSGREVSCAIRKDGGDDPDVTDGALIYARVGYAGSGPAGDSPSINILAGPGVGRVTRPGLDCPVGSAAINRVPREMIVREVRQVCELLDYRGALDVEISVPDGERLAARTFNPRLGIEGGISILGTTGIVEPMSSRALLETIRLELAQRLAEGNDAAVISPGNYGREFIKKTYGYDLDKSVKCGNYIGDTIDMAAEQGFSKLLLAGHIGKLIKLSGGIMNTHSAQGDCRMELLAASAIRRGADAGIARRILDCALTEEALRILDGEGILRDVMAYAMERIFYYLDRRAGGRIQIGCIMYSGEYGELGKINADDFPGSY